MEVSLPKHLKGQQAAPFSIFKLSFHQDFLSNHITMGIHCDVDVGEWLQNLNWKSNCVNFSSNFKSFCALKANEALQLRKCMQAPVAALPPILGQLENGEGLFTVSHIDAWPTTPASSTVWGYPGQWVTNSLKLFHTSEKQRGFFSLHWKVSRAEPPSPEPTAWAPPMAWQQTCFISGCYTPSQTFLETCHQREDRPLNPTVLPGWSEHASAQYSSSHSNATKAKLSTTGFSLSLTEKLMLLIERNEARNTFFFLKQQFEKQSKENFFQPRVAQRRE